MRQTPSEFQPSDHFLKSERNTHDISCLTDFQIYRFLFAISFILKYFLQKHFECFSTSENTKYGGTLALENFSFEVLKMPSLKAFLFGIVACSVFNVGHAADKNIVIESPSNQILMHTKIDQK